MFTEDISLFFNSNEFGDTATIDGSSVIGIFDNQYFEDGFVGSTRPVFICQTSDVTAVSEDSTLVLSGTTYFIKGPLESDGTGITTLVLQKQ